jgi:cyclase
MASKNPFKSGGMFEGASHLIFENAKQLRKNMTEAEMVLWLNLKKGIGGLKFRRQHPISIYIADFYCHKIKLVIEVDGSIHNIPEIKEADVIRQEELEKLGCSILRFTNQQVSEKMEDVLQIINEKIEALNNLHKQRTPQ